MASSDASGSKLPTNRAEWGKAIKAANLETTSIHDPGSYASASKARFNQTLLLRVVFPPQKKAVDFDSSTREKFLDQSYHMRAVELLRRRPEWKKYCGVDVNPTSQKPFPELMDFSLVYYYQLQSAKISSNVEHSEPKIFDSPIANRTRQRRQLVASTSGQPMTPSRPGQAWANLETPDLDMAQIDSSLAGLAISPREDVSDTSSTDQDLLSDVSAAGAYGSTDFEAVKDEQIVNTALIMLLNALTYHAGNIGEWTLHRRRFILGQDSEKGFEGRVDGLLETRDGRVMAIAEVKPHIRLRCLDKIRMQEAAQMAAWISSNPPPPGTEIRQRLLVSQDRHEIYLTFAEFDRSYVDYLAGQDNGKNAKGSPSLMKMKTYGPYEITRHTHMKVLGEFLLGWTIQSDARK